MIQNPYPSLTKLFLGAGYKNRIVFCLILLFNAGSALLEGLSFTIILGALSILSDSNTILPFHFLMSYLEGFSRQTMCLFLVVAAISLQGIRSIIGAVALYWNTKLSLTIQRETQLVIYQKIFRFSYRFVSEYKTGDLAEYTKTPSVLMNSFTDHVNKLIVSVFMALAILGVMFILEAKLACTALFFLVFFGASQRFVIKVIGQSSTKLSDQIVDCAKQTTQAFQSIRMIHSYNRQSYILDKIKPVLNEIMKQSKKVYFWQNMIPSMSELTGTFLVTAILLTGAFVLSNKEGNLLPLLITFLALTHRLAIRLQTASVCLGIIWSHKGSLGRLEDILSEEDKEWGSTGLKPFSSFSSSIEFHDVFLQYPSSEKPSVQGVTLSIPKGKVVAFVGSSGAGKSSVLDLLLRLYEPTGGVIKVDGVNLADYDTGSWRKALGVVSQDVSILNDTIEENICFGQVNLSDRKVDQALKWAGLETFVESLPQKKQTLVGERGFRLSGGQRQRIAMARALVRNPEILILDEATSSLDSHSESLIQSALEELREGRTILIVAHRLSTIMNADIIYVLNDGKIVECGNHSSLLKAGGVYARFWQLQQEKESVFK